MPYLSSVRVRVLLIYFRKISFKPVKKVILIRIVFLNVRFLISYICLIHTNYLFYRYIRIERIRFISLILINLYTFKTSEVSIKYFIFNSVASRIFLIRLLITFAILGTTSMLSLSLISNEVSGISIRIFLFFIAIGIKLGLVPFALSLIDRYSGLTFFIFIWINTIIKLPYLSFIYLFIQSIPTYASGQLRLLLIGCASLILGALGRVSTFLIKRFLRWSARNQIGYIFIIFAINTSTVINRYIIIFIRVYIFIYIYVYNYLFLNRQNINNYNIVEFRSDMISHLYLNKHKNFLQTCLIRFVLLNLIFFPLSIIFFPKYNILRFLFSQNYYITSVVVISVGVITVYYYSRFSKLRFLDYLK